MDAQGNVRGGTDGGAIAVELDIFSGRPNPRWEIDGVAAGELRLVQSTLQATDQAAPEPPGLGYRGFRYADGARTWRAFGGFVATAGSVLADPGRRVERYLLDHLPAPFQDLRGLVAGELGPPP